MLLLLCLFALVPVVPAGAARPVQSGDTRLDDLEEELASVSAAEAVKLREAAAARARRVETETRVRGIDAQLARVAADQRGAEERLNVVGGRLLALDQGRRLAEAEVQRTGEGAKVAAQQLYKQSASSTQSVTELASSLSDAGAALSAQHYLEVVQREQRRNFVRRQIAREELAYQQSRFEGEQAEVVALRDRAVSQKAELDRLRAELDVAQQESAAAEEREQAALSQVQSQKAAVEREIAQAKADAERVARQIRGGGSSEGSRPGALVRPSSGPITSRFGPRVHPIFGVVKFHYGIDFGAGAGSPIRAAAAGKVLSAGWIGGYGNTTIIDHGGGMATLYAHQSSFGVSAGQQVSAGQTIGAVGSTGNSTGPHLHFEVRVNGQAVDPAGYL
jgi:murein DD-endopeptidase MepM/ murein hydrolase activator NlpD